VSGLSLKQLFAMVQVIAAIAGTSASDSYSYDELPHYDLQGLGLRGSVRTVITRSAFFVTTESFDRAGRLAEVISDTTEKRRGWPLRDVYHYSEFDKPDSIMMYDWDDVLRGKSVFAYDEVGNPSLKITVMDDGRLREVVHYGTNGSNQITTQIYFNENGAFRERIEYRYDDKNKLVLADNYHHEVRNTYRNNVLAQELWHNKAFRQVERIKKLNELADLAITKEFTRDGAPLNETVYSYEYDASGNWIRQAISQFIFKEGQRVPDGTSTVTRAIDYYPN
jgi:hypothetical protein